MRRVLPLMLLMVVRPVMAEDIDALVARLNQPLTGSTDAERRAVLERIGAEVPDQRGVFRPPPRQTGKRKGEPDWLADLAQLPDTPAVRDAISVVTTLRALGETRSEKAAGAILAFAFSADGMAFRDECGRILRKMSPHSVPTLLRATQDKKRAGGSYARYASYQLDRLEKNRPAYALAAAPNDELEVAILHAIRDVRHPDAVTAVLDRTNAPSHAVRRAAREAWLAYVTGPPPPPAPKAKRKLAGGKLSDEPLPLYLTYREFAEIELRRVLSMLTGREPDPKLDAAAMTRILFDLYDKERAAIWDSEMKAAADLGAQGKWAEACARYDRILMQDPTYAGRAEMTAGYRECGRQLAVQAKWEDAVGAFHKAYLVASDGAAREAAAELAEARGARTRARVSSASGQAEAAAWREGGARTRDWMLYAGVAAGALALGLLVVGLMLRRRHAR